MKTKILFPLLSLLMVAGALTPVFATPGSAVQTVQAHGQCTEIWVALSWVYIGAPDLVNYPFLNHEVVTGPWQVTVQPDTGKAEFNAAVKTSEGIIKFELARVDSVQFDGTILIVEGAIKEKHRGNWYVFDMTGTKITVNLLTGEMDLDLANDDNNLLGFVKSGGAHPN